jgi:hypothetical protein
MNALAFVLDGLYYGVSDFGYAAYSMVHPSFYYIGIHLFDLFSFLSSFVVMDRCLLG